MTHPPAHQHTGVFRDVLRLVFLELTAACNLHCRHCRADAQPLAAPDELTREELVRVAAEIRAIADPIIILSGGEPLLRPDFFPIVEDYCALFSRVALASNGTLLDDALIRRLMTVGVQRVSVSLDGARAETHDNFRGQAGSYAAALRGCASVRRAGMPLQINVSAGTHNAHELPELLELAQQLGADALHLFLLVPVGCGVELSESERLSAQQVEDLLTWLSAQSVALRDTLHLKATCAPMYYRILQQQPAARSLTQPAASGMHAVTRGCLAGSAVCFISREGKVQPCGYLPVSAGDVREQPFARIWQQSALFTTLRNPKNLSGKCAVCPFSHACFGCRARAYAVHGDYLAEEPDCVYLPPTISD